MGKGRMCQNPYYGPPDLVLNREAHLNKQVDGTRFWADVIITALTDQEGQLWGFAKVTRDMTERRKAEMELEQRVTERTAQLQDAVDELQGYIAERQRAEKERARLMVAIEQERATLAAVMASMSDGLLVLDAAHQVCVIWVSGRSCLVADYWS
jgi:PAS domain-containing protein